MPGILGQLGAAPLTPSTVTLGTGDGVVGPPQMVVTGDPAGGLKPGWEAFGHGLVRNTTTGQIVPMNHPIYTGDWSTAAPPPPPPSAAAPVPAAAPAPPPDSNLSGTLGSLGGSTPASSSPSPTLAAAIGAGPSNFQTIAAQPDLRGAAPSGPIGLGQTDVAQPGPADMPSTIPLANPQTVSTMAASPDDSTPLNAALQRRRAMFRRSQGYGTFGGLRQANAFRGPGGPSLM